MNGRRMRVGAVVLALLVAPAAGAYPQEVPRPGLSEQAVRDLLGIYDRSVTPVEADGLRGYSVPLTAAEVEAYRREAKAKNQLMLASGRALSLPTSLSSAITGVTIECGLSYVYWFGIINFSSAKTFQVTRSLKGPGDTFSRKSDVTFEASTVTLLGESVEHEVGDGNDGVYTYKAIAKGGPGKTTNKFYATGFGC